MILILICRCTVLNKTSGNRYAQYTVSPNKHGNSVTTFNLFTSAQLDCKINIFRVAWQLAWRGREVDTTLNQSIYILEHRNSCKIYSEPLWSYSEPLNFVPNPALFNSQQLYFCYLFYQFTLSLSTELY